MYVEGHTEYTRGNSVWTTGILGTHVIGSFLVNQNLKGEIYL